MLHHEVVYFLVVFGPPLFLVVGVVEIPLPFCCLNDVGRVRGVLRKNDGWCLEFSHGEGCERAIVFEAVREVFRESLAVVVEGGRHLGSPRVIKDYVLQPLRGHRERCFLWGKGAMSKMRFISLDLRFLFGLGRFWSRHWSRGCLINESRGRWL